MTEAVIRFALGNLLFVSLGSAQEITLASGANRVRINLLSLPPATLDLRDPTDSEKHKRLIGPRLSDVLARLAPPPGADTLAVRCDDGWLSLIPLSAVPEFPGALLALRIEENGKERPLESPRGPVYLAFPNIPRRLLKTSDRAHSALYSELAENGWSFAVSSIEYVARGAFLSPLAGAPEPGASLFVEHCLHCHAFRGVGGLAAWDLSRPPLFSYRDEARVRDYVRDPRRFNPSGHMPSFAKVLSARRLDALIGFLERP